MVGYDRRMLASVDLALMGDTADIETAGSRQTRKDRVGEARPMRGG
jgi:hypothetical protein